MRALSLLVTLLLCASPRAVHAETNITETTDAKGEARRYFQAGVSLQKTDDFEAASEAYTTSLDFFPTKSALFNLANCQRAMHRYADAWHSLHRLQEQFGTQLGEPMLTTSRAQLEELENLTGLVTVESQPSGAMITLDGQPLGTTPLAAPRRVTIGQHVAQASFKGYAEKSATFKLSPKQSLTLGLELELAAQPPPTDVKPTPLPEPVATQNPTPTTSAPKPSVVDAANEPSGLSNVWKTAGWVGIALGGVAIAVGARNGFLALDVNDHLATVCEAGHCSQQYAANVERLDRLSLAANVFIGVGAAFVATGATLVLWSASASESEQVTLTVSPSAVQIGGRF